MRFVIVGAGAVGGTIGARLHQAGEDVLLVARGEHARVLAAQGLDFRTPDDTVRLQLPVADSSSGLGDLGLRDDDVLVMTTKTQDSLPLLESLAALTTAGGRPGSSLPVVCIQNGVENERLAGRRFERVYGSCVMLPASRLEPGVVLATGRPRSGMLDIGRWPLGVDETCQAVAAALVGAGFLSVAEPRIMRWKYAKLLRNLGNAIEALTGGELSANDRPVRAEAELILASASIDVTPDAEYAERRGDQVQDTAIAGLQRGGGSSWQSLTLGAGSIEADYLNGEICYVARQLGRTAPLNQLLQRLANEAARTGAKPGDLSGTQLRAMLDQAAGG